MNVELIGKNTQWCSTKWKQAKWYPRHIDTPKIIQFWNFRVITKNRRLFTYFLYFLRIAVPLYKIRRNAKFAIEHISLSTNYFIEISSISWRKTLTLKSFHVFHVLLFPLTFACLQSPSHWSLLIAVSELKLHKLTRKY